MYLFRYLITSTLVRLEDRDIDGYSAETGTALYKKECHLLILQFVIRWTDTEASGILLPLFSGVMKSNQSNHAWYTCSFHEANQFRLIGFEGRDSMIFWKSFGKDIE